MALNILNLSNTVSSERKVKQLKAINWQALLVTGQQKLVVAQHFCQASPSPASAPNGIFAAFREASCIKSQISPYATCDLKAETN